MPLLLQHIIVKHKVSALAGDPQRNRSPHIFQHKALSQFIEGKFVDDLVVHAQHHLKIARIHPGVIDDDLVAIGDDVGAEHLVDTGELFGRIPKAG